MSYTYAQRKKAATRADAAPSAAPERLNALERGAAKPTAETGHRADLSDAMRARMESSFGDVSALRESQTADSSLAGRERAAGGTSVYGGASAPLSTASAAPAAGPMQASRKKETPEEKAARYNEKAERLAAIQAGMTGGAKVSDKDQAWYEQQTQGAFDENLIFALLSKQADATKRMMDTRNQATGADEKELDLQAMGGTDSADAGLYDQVIEDTFAGRNRLWESTMRRVNNKLSPEQMEAIAQSKEMQKRMYNTHFKKFDEVYDARSKQVEADTNKHYQQKYTDYAAQQAQQAQQKKWWQFWK